MNQFNKSLEGALKLLGAGTNPEDLVTIKLEPFPNACCCFHCWPETWKGINKYITPQGPIRDEGDLLLGIDGENFVLQCHETGPEIIAFIESSIKLVNYVIEIILLFLSSLRKENKHPAKIKIIKRRTLGLEIKEECLFEIEMSGKNLNKEQLDGLRKIIKETLTK